MGASRDGEIQSPLCHLSSEKRIDLLDAIEKYRKTDPFEVLSLLISNTYLLGVRSCCE